MKGRVKEQKGIEYYMQLPYSILLHEIEDEGEKYWIAEIPELPGCKSHGSTVEQAVMSVEEAKKDWIIDSLEEGEEVPVPIERDRFSGKTLVRMSRSLHRALSLMAETEKLSLNQLIVTILAKEVGRLAVLNRAEEKLDKLLDKINDVLEEGELRVVPSKSLRVIMEPHELEQSILVSTGYTLEVPAVRGAYIGMGTPAAVSTATPFEELWSYPYSQCMERERIIFSPHRVEESEHEDAFKSGQK